MYVFALLIPGLKEILTLTTVHDLQHRPMLQIKGRCDVSQQYPLMGLVVTPCDTVGSLLSTSSALDALDPFDAHFLVALR